MKTVDFLFPLIWVFLLACYVFVDPSKVSNSDLNCFPANDDFTHLVAWCDPGHFHVTYPIEGGTVSVSGGNLPTPLKCPVTPSKE